MLVQMCFAFQDNALFGNWSGGFVSQTKINSQVIFKWLQLPWKTFITVISYFWGLHLRLLVSGNTKTDDEVCTPAEILRACRESFDWVGDSECRGQKPPRKVFEFTNQAKPNNLYHHLSVINISSSKLLIGPNIKCLWVAFNQLFQFRPTQGLVYKTINRYQFQLKKPFIAPVLCCLLLQMRKCTILPCFLWSMNWNTFQSDNSREMNERVYRVILLRHLGSDSSLPVNTCQSKLRETGSGNRYLTPLLSDL